MFLLDTNIISEWWVVKPSPQVIQWVEENVWHVPAPVIAEIQEGAEASPSVARKIQINALLDKFLESYEGLVLPWDTETARVWGRLQHSQEVIRKPQALWDSVIDAMAVRYDVTIVTRNGKDFRHGKTFNPFDLPAKASA